MSAPDQLPELRRQRALVQEHLAWLDRQIASAESTRPTPAPPAATAAHAAAAPSTALPTPADAEHDADVILSKYSPSPADVQREVRKGCLIYFIVALIVIGAAVAGLYMALRR